MKKNVLNVIICFVLSYLIFLIISFLIFSVVSVDTVIAVGLSLLFYLFYFFGHKQISNFLVNQNKNIFIFFIKLIYLVLSLKIFIMILNKSYLDFLWYKFNGLNISILNVNFVELKVSLIKFFNINKLYNLFVIKLMFIDNFIKNINNLEYNNNNLIYLNILKNLEFIIFLNHG